MHHFFSIAGSIPFELLDYNWNNLFLPSETVGNTIPVSSVSRDGATATIIVVDDPHGCEPGDIVTYVEGGETGIVTYIDSDELSIPSTETGPSVGGNLLVPDRPVSLGDFSGLNSLDVQSSYIGYAGSMIDGVLRMARSSRYNMAPESNASDTLYFAFVIEPLEDFTDRVGNKTILQIDSGNDGLALYGSGVSNNLILECRQGIDVQIDYVEGISKNALHLIEVVWKDDVIYLYIDGIIKGFRITDAVPTDMGDLFISYGQFSATSGAEDGFVHNLHFIGISKEILRNENGFVSGLCNQYDISYTEPSAIQGTSGLPVEGPATWANVDLWIDFTVDELKSTIGDEIIEIQPRVNNGSWSNFTSYNKGPQDQGSDGISFDGIIEALLGKRGSPYNTPFITAGSTWIVILADYDPSTAVDDSSFMSFVGPLSSSDYSSIGARILGKDFGSDDIELAYNSRAGSHLVSPPSGVVWAIAQRASRTVDAYNVSSNGQKPSASSRGYSSNFNGQELSFGKFFGNDSCKFRILHAILINDLLTNSEINAFSSWIESTGVNWTDL